MRMLLVLIPCLFLYSNVLAQGRTVLKDKKYREVAVAEPSDMCLTPSGEHFYIVSDNGFLVKTNLDFQQIQKAEKELYDPEAVFCDSAFIYVVEERSRNLILFDHISLKPIRTLHFPYSGGRNKGYEAFTYNLEKQTFILITEREPIIVFELDKTFKVFNQFEFDYRGDISSASWYKGKLWLLSDENMELLRINTDDYSIEHVYELPVINPEGFQIMPDGRLIVLSDDMQRAYYFDFKANEINK